MLIQCMATASQHLPCLLDKDEVTQNKRLSVIFATSRELQLLGNCTTNNYMLQHPYLCLSGDLEYRTSKSSIFRVWNYNGNENEDASMSSLLVEELFKTSYSAVTSLGVCMFTLKTSECFLEVHSERENACTQNTKALVN
eukprot:6390238-Amphidinium_carterae.1